MTETQITIFVAVVPIVISVFFSIITAFVTQKLTHKNDVKKWILEKRCALYLKIYPRIEEILHNRTIVFSDSYFKYLVEIKPEVKLISSKDTFEAFEQYFLFILKNNREYHKFCLNNDPRNDPKHFWIDTDPNGEEYEADDITEQDLQYFGAQEKNYISDNTPDADTVKSYIEGLYSSMRVDLGSNLK